MTIIKYLEDAGLMIRGSSETGSKTSFDIYKYRSDGEVIDYMNGAGEWSKYIDNASPVIEGYINNDGTCERFFNAEHAFNFRPNMNDLVNEVRAIKVAYMIAAELMPGSEIV